MMNKRMTGKITALLLAAAFLLAACGAKKDAPAGAANQNTSAGTANPVVAAGTANPGVPAGTAEEDAYHVAVTDEAGDPVPGVLIQFCSDTLCMAEETGQDGIASWKTEAGTYTVHVLKVPEGYAEDPTEYAAPAKPGTVAITLLKAEGQEKP